MLSIPNEMNIDPKIQFSQVVTFVGYFVKISGTRQNCNIQLHIAHPIRSRSREYYHNIKQICCENTLNLALE